MDAKADHVVHAIEERLRRCVLRLPLVPLVLAASLGLSLSAARAEDAAKVWQAPPGWASTHGGQGGRVISVETLAAEGPGSLGAALAEDGPRTVVFKVGGVIDLNFDRYRIESPRVTIAGETAPSPGITITRGGINVATHDVILRHVRVRPGTEGRAIKSGWEIDSFSTLGGAYDVIVDHCSLSWGTDENLSASGPRFEGETPSEWRKNTSHRITFSQCIVAEGLRNAAHGKGPHSMGTLVHDNTNDILIYGNLYISNNGRNPLFKGGARGAVINNFIHNPGGAALSYCLVPEEWGKHEWQRGVLSVIGNVMTAGRDTGRSPSFALYVGSGPCDAYFADNLLMNSAGETVPASIRFREKWGGPATEQDTLKALRKLDAPPFVPPGLHVRPAAEVERWVLENAGARPWDRDAVDQRLVEQARTNKGKIIDSEAEVGGRDALAEKK